MQDKKRDTQIECPHCHSFKTTPASRRMKTINTGGALLLIGGILTWFFVWIVGVPMFILGIVITFTGMFMKETGEMSCQNCNFKFVDKQLAEKGAQEAKDFFKITFRWK